MSILTKAGYGYPAGALFFRGERIRCPVSCITRSKGGRSKVIAVLRKTISQKKIPLKPRNGLIFKDLPLRSYGRISGRQPERAYKILKNKTIGNKACRYRLEKISGTRFVVTRLSKMPLAVTTSLGHLFADNFFRHEKKGPCRTTGKLQSSKCLVY